MSYQIWLICGILLLIGEVFTLDFTLSCIGIAFLVAGLFSWVNFGTSWQLITASLTLVILFFTLRPFALKYLMKSGTEYKSNIDALIGKKVKVYDITEDKKHAKVKFDADVWEVFCEEDLSLDSFVKIVKVKGITLIVKKED